MREVVAFDRDRVKQLTCLGEVLITGFEKFQKIDEIKRDLIANLAFEIAKKLVEHEKVLIALCAGPPEACRYVAEVTIIVPGGGPPTRLALPL